MNKFQNLFSLRSTPGFRFITSVWVAILLVVFAPFRVARKMRSRVDQDYLERIATLPWYDRIPLWLMKGIGDYSAITVMGELDWSDSPYVIRYDSCTVLRRSFFFWGILFLLSGIFFTAGFSIATFLLDPKVNPEAIIPAIGFVLCFFWAFCFSVTSATLIVLIFVATVIDFCVLVSPVFRRRLSPSKKGPTLTEKIQEAWEAVSGKICVTWSHPYPKRNSSRND